eukprot:g1703.t1
MLPLKDPLGRTYSTPEELRRLLQREEARQLAASSLGCASGSSRYDFLAQWQEDCDVSSAAWQVLCVVLCVEALIIVYTATSYMQALVAKNRTHTALFKASVLLFFGCAFLFAWGLWGAVGGDAEDGVIGDQALWMAVFVQSLCSIVLSFTTLTFDVFAAAAIDLFYVMHPKRAVAFRSYCAAVSNVLGSVLPLVVTYSAIVVSQYRPGGNGGARDKGLRSFGVVFAAVFGVSSAGNLAAAWSMTHTARMLGDAVEVRPQRNRLLRMRAITMGAFVVFSLAGIGFVATASLSSAQAMSGVFVALIFGCVLLAACPWVVRTLLRQCSGRLASAIVAPLRSLPAIGAGGEQKSKRISMVGRIHAEVADALTRQLPGLTGMADEAQSQMASRIAQEASNQAEKEEAGRANARGQDNREQSSPSRSALLLPKLPSFSTRTAQRKQSARVSESTDMVIIPLCCRGVSLRFLKAFIEQKGVGSRMTTAEVCDNIIKPTTVRAKCSYYDMLQVLDRAHPGEQPWAGRSSYFLSHSWSYRFVELINIIETFESQSQPEHTVYYWFDIFVMNQHDKNEMARLLSNLQDSVRTPGKLLLAVDSWKEPTALTRAWCLLEVYTAMVEDADMVLGFSGSEEQTFVRQLAENQAVLEATLSSVDAEQADATKEADKDMIFGTIRADIGFAKFNATIRKALRKSLQRILIDFHLRRATLKMIS